MRQVARFGGTHYAATLFASNRRRDLFFFLYMTVMMMIDLLLMILAGTSVDQGIAYVLMLVALVLTYLIHPLDASSSAYRLF